MRGNEIVNGQAVRCYFNSNIGGIDPWTVVYMDQRESSFQHHNVYACVGLSGHSGARLGRHLGKRIPFSDIEAGLRQTVENDLSEAAITRAA